MLLIGAAGRNVGKTEFACELIRRHAAQHAVIGVKITVIREQGGACPRGGTGCGVCSSLSEPFRLTEEHEGVSDKDTARMRRAGARRVFWLRVHQAALTEGVRALREACADHVPIICESNTARLAITPGVFLVIREAHVAAIKDSCRQVLHLADRQLLFTGTGWDLPPDDFCFAAGRWWPRLEATAIILAGGRSRRMGQDKSLLPFGGQPLLAHIADQLRPHFRHLLVGANDPLRYALAGAPVIADRTPDQGPLMGLASCLAAAPTETAFLTGCDIPTMEMATIRAMLAALPDHDAVIPVTPDGRRHPLFAAYRRTLVPTALNVLAGGLRRMEDLLQRVRVHPFPLPESPWFQNLNTPAEYAAATCHTPPPPELP
jgi:molybdopterin-guanine dinucleotide biosynthesis protein A